MAVWGFNRWIALNTGTNWGYGTWGTAEHSFNVTSAAWTRTVEVQDSLDEFSGYEANVNAGTQYLLACSIQGDMAGRATPHAVAILGYAALGSISSGTAGTLGTAATAYRHRIRPVKVASGTTDSGTLPALHVTESLSGTSDFQFDYQSCMVNTFSLQASRKSWITYTASLVGNGVFRTSSIAKPAVVTENYLKAGDCKIFFGTSAAATPNQDKATSDITGTGFGDRIDMTARVIDFNWSVNNNLLLDDGYGMNSGTTRDHMWKGRRTQTLTTTLELRYTDQLSILESQKVCAMEIECYNGLIESNAYYGFNLVFPKLVLLSATPQGAPSDMVTVAMEWSVVEDTTKGSVMLDVYNTRSAYLT